MFPDEKSATHWFESVIWQNGRHCGKCGSTNTRPVKSEKPMPYWCTDCRSYFSVRTGTAIARSNIPLQKWAIAVYLCLTSLKSVSSMKLHRDIGVSQPTAWFMLHRIRESWMHDSNDNFNGPIEADETYVGGKEANKHESKKLKSGRGAVGKTAVVGVKDRNTNKVRAKTVQNTDAKTLQGFIAGHANPDGMVFTDDATAYSSMPFKHGTVKHSVGEYVKQQIHINGMESFWAMLKRAHKGTFHKISKKHLDRYVHEFAGKHNIRKSDTLFQMRDTIAGLIGRNLLRRDLIADNGLDSGARS